MSNSLWPHGCSPPGSFVHGILQARILEWVACPPLESGHRSVYSAELQVFTVCFVSAGNETANKAGSILALGEPSFSWGGVEVESQIINKLMSKIISENGKCCADNMTGCCALACAGWVGEGGEDSSLVIMESLFEEVTFYVRPKWWERARHTQEDLGTGCSSKGFTTSSVQFSRSVVSDSLRPHESQHTRPPCPSSTPGVHSDSRPSSQWCHPAISSSVVPFSSCPQSLPASRSFPKSQLFAWAGQSTGV